MTKATDHLNLYFLQCARIVVRVLWAGDCSLSFTGAAQLTDSGPTRTSLITHFNCKNIKHIILKCFLLVRWRCFRKPLCTCKKEIIEFVVNRSQGWGAWSAVRPPLAPHCGEARQTNHFHKTGHY